MEHFSWSDIPLMNCIIVIFQPFRGLSVSVRRLHDINKSGWWLLLSITIIGLIPLLYWACKKGDDDGNKYGPNSIILKKVKPFTFKDYF